MRKLGVKDKIFAFKGFITGKCEADGWDSLISQQLRKSWVNVLGTEPKSFEEIEKWLWKQYDDQDIDKLFQELSFRYTTLCDIENVPEEIKCFFPKLIASYPITNRSVINGGDTAREFCKTSFGDVFEEKLKGCFFKLSSRSAKDWRKLRAMDIEDIVSAFDSSIRFCDDIWQYFNFSHPINLNFYEWLDDCKSTNEVRCFIKKRKLEGISKYHGDKPATYSSSFIDKVTKFIEAEIIPASKNWIGDFVVDCYEKADGAVGVIEFNPYEYSDPCLYCFHQYIGRPPVIEEDIYGLYEKLHKNLF